MLEVLLSLIGFVRADRRADVALPSTPAAVPVGPRSRPLSPRHPQPRPHPRDRRGADRLLITSATWTGSCSGSPVRDRRRSCCGAGTTATRSSASSSRGPGTTRIRIDDRTNHPHAVADSLKEISKALDAGRLVVDLPGGNADAERAHAPLRPRHRDGVEADHHRRPGDSNRDERALWRVLQPRRRADPAASCRGPSGRAWACGLASP